MPPASQQYLAELADEFLALMTGIGWRGLSESSNGRSSWGETTWVDPSNGEPGVDVSTSFRQRDDGDIEVEVVAYDGDEKAKAIARKALVSR